MQSLFACSQLGNLGLHAMGNNHWAIQHADLFDCIFGETIEPVEAVVMTIQSTQSLALERRKDLLVQRRSEGVLHKRIFGCKAADRLQSGRIDSTTIRVQVVADLEAEHFAEYNVVALVAVLDNTMDFAFHLNRRVLHPRRAHLV